MAWGAKWMDPGITEIGNSKGEAHSGGHGDGILDRLGLGWLSEESIL